jgi:hypothetical protein
MIISRGGSGDGWFRLLYGFPRYCLFILADKKLHLDHV